MNLNHPTTTTGQGQVGQQQERGRQEGRKGSSMTNQQQQLTGLIEKMVAEVPGDNRVFKMNRRTYDDNFGPANRDDYTHQFIKVVQSIPVEIDPTAADGMIYLTSQPEPDDWEEVEAASPVYHCPDCGGEVQVEGQCIFCFAIASIGG